MRVGFDCRRLRSPRWLGSRADGNHPNNGFPKAKRDFKRSVCFRSIWSPLFSPLHDSPSIFTILSDSTVYKDLQDGRAWRSDKRKGGRRGWNGISEAVMVKEQVRNTMIKCFYVCLLKEAVGENPCHPRGNNMPATNLFEFSKYIQLNSRKKWLGFSCQRLKVRVALTSTSNKQDNIRLPPVLVGRCF